ncbi:hypothetical protein BKA83DRAFT_4489804 [Pisolithus microcarpus]|nr:hypothetical protein BKA83DRAFT_4489804 [Pisolithus microcarpus]
MSISNLPPYWENGQPTESPDGYSCVLAVVQQERGLTQVESPAPEFFTSSASKHATNTSFQRSHPMGSGERYDNRTSVVETDMSQESTTDSVSRRGSACADDECSEEELRIELDERMVYIWEVIGRLLNKKCRDCPKKRELWLSIIEGNTDDDLWLWVDGDEEWLREQQIISCSGYPDPTDRPNAQSALRRRIARKRYPPVTARNEKVRNATPEKRACAIAWLVASSKGVEKLFVLSGCTPPMFRTPEIASTLTSMVGKWWNTFPAQTNTWENTLTRTKEDGTMKSQDT